MKELTCTIEANKPIDEKEIQRKYANKLYGTENPNIIVTVKGGDKRDSFNLQSTPKAKQSSLRRKIINMP